MPTFRYDAYRADGSLLSGTLDAASIGDARTRLKEKSLLLRNLEEAVQKRGRFSRNRIATADLALLTRRLATLVGASVPVHEAISTLYEQEAPGALREMLGGVRERIGEGIGLSRALAGEESVFSESYLAMVSAGEASGSLALVLERLAGFLEDQESLRSTLTTALAYPVLMLLVGGGVMSFLLTFVIPRIVTVFTQSKAALPLITVIVIGTSRFLQHWWWALLIVAGLLLFGFRRLLTVPLFRERFDRWRLSLPLYGGALKRLILARFSRVLGLLLTSGVPLVRSLEIAAAVTANRAYQKDLQQVREDVIQGKSLAVSLGGTVLFPSLLVHMVAVGERSGQLEAMLDKSGDAFAREFETTVKRLMGLLEPALVLGMGLAVGIVVIAVLLPIFEMNQLIK